MTFLEWWVHVTLSRGENVTSNDRGWSLVTFWITWEFDFRYLLNRFGPAKTTWSLERVYFINNSRGLLFQLVFDFMGKPFAASVQFQSSSILVWPVTEKGSQKLGCGTPLTSSNGHQDDGWYFFWRKFWASQQTQPLNRRKDLGFRATRFSWFDYFFSSRKYEFLPSPWKSSKPTIKIMTSNPY